MQTAATDATLADAIPDDLILAAIERSERHRVQRGAPRWEIYDHLDIKKQSREARHVREQVAALSEAGLLEASRAHNIAMWVLTKKGRRRLRRAGDVEALLPESPQHRTWARARTLGEREIDRFCESLRDVLAEALQTLSVPASSVPSDAWYELGRRLDRHASRLGSVIHCLHEWAEPNDGTPDIDEHRNRSRRSFCFWGWADELDREHAASNGEG